MSDSDDIYRECKLAETSGREISHGTARAIASQWHDGSTLALAFVSTGTIYRADLWQMLCGDSYDNMSHRERWAADMLGTYLLNRVKHNDCGPIEGWSDKWIGDE